MILSNQQKILLNIAKEQGFITLGQAGQIYSDPNFLRNAIRRLINGGYLKESEKPNRFDYISKETK